MTKTVTLGEICEIYGGGTPSREVKEYFGGGIPWLTPTEIPKDRIGQVSSSKETLTKEGLSNSSAKLLPIGSVLMTSRASIGNIAIADNQVTTNQGFISFVCPHNLYNKYLAYWLFTQKGKFENAANGATFKEISRGTIKEFSIPLPPLPEQRRIASLLDHTDALRQKDRQLLAHYDKLAQSVFLDLFGDGQNYKQLPLESVSVYKEGLKCGPFGTQLHATSFQKEGVPLWGIKQVNKSFLLPTHEFLTTAKAHELRTYNLIPGDLVMTRKGTVGNCALYPEGFTEGIMHSDLLRIRLDTSKVNSLFINYQLKHSSHVEHQISLISNGAIMAGINVTKLKLVEVFVPPLSLQTHFANVIEKIERQKAVARQQMAASEGLFGRLLQESFG